MQIDGDRHFKQNWLIEQKSAGKFQNFCSKWKQQNDVSYFQHMHKQDKMKAVLGTVYINNYLHLKIKWIQLNDPER